MTNQKSQYPSMMLNYLASGGICQKVGFSCYTDVVVIVILLITRGYPQLSFLLSIIIIIIFFCSFWLGGFQEFQLLERLGEGKKPTSIIGEVADDLNLDLVVLSMESIHSKHVDGNLLAEFVPCPVLLLPL